jgi:hypothetical protein
MKPSACLRLLSVGVLLLWTCSACENTVEPFTESDRVPFALFGVLNVNADTQFVRVSPVRKSLDKVTAAARPESVRSTSLASGLSTVWQDSVISLEDRSPGLVYFASFAPEPGASYVLELASKDGEPTRAFTQVPDGSRFSLLTPTADTLGFLRQRTIWPGVRSVRETTVAYRVRALPSRRETTLAFQYGEFGRGISGDWSVEVHLERDRRRISQSLAITYGDTLATLLDITMTLEILSPEWRADDGSNIENGRGFFASFGRFSQSWMLDDSTAIEIGFVPNR